MGFNNTEILSSKWYLILSPNFLLYGANGYTGKLVLEELLKQNLKPIIGGRNSEQIKSLAVKHSLSYRIFSLNNHNDVLISLENIQILLNCAGPFIRTAKPLLKACLEKNVHYFDITGEIDVFEYAHSLDQKAKEQGIIICPGVGFDVVPTDCLALLLKEQFKYQADTLEIAFELQGGFSNGTALTSLGGSGNKTRIRRNGKLESLPYGKLSKEISFPHKILAVTSIPWGDVYTSYISTEIPNITVYMAIHPKMIARMRRLQKFFFLKDYQPFKYLVGKIVKRSIPTEGGPSGEVRKNSKCLIWGCVSDTSNIHKLEMFLQTPNGYDLTAVLATKTILIFDLIDSKSGYFTPSQLFGSEFILGFSKVQLIDK